DCAMFPYCKCLAPATILTLILLSTAQSDQVKKELETLQGEWSLIGREVDGQKSNEEEVKALQIRIVIKGDQLLFKSLGDAEWQKSTLKINLQGASKSVDVSGDNKGAKKDVLGIYKLEGDLLTVCNSVAERPTDFTAPKGSGRALLVFRR